MLTIVGLISALAWPAVTVWLVIKFSDDLKQLILRLSRVKMGSAEAEFAENLAKAEAMANEEPVVQVNVNEREEAEFSKRLSLLQRIAEVSPRAAILESWLLIEEAAGKSGFIQGGTVPRINSLLFIDWLVKEGRIAPSTVNLIKKMRLLRNEAAHTLGDFELTKDEAERYLKLAVQISLLIIEPEQALDND
ncbi:DUF4145 domain-containing protein [Rahnella aceris]|uniref:DUF4145 domain-containing protein n=1 Tax=Rahnella sp. (strain Y9602) TaxID=2703885 RepID=UPI003FD6B9BA